MNKNRIFISELDKDTLERATHKVIDALSEFSPEYKIGALYVLMEEFPIPYVIEEEKL